MKAAWDSGWVQGCNVEPGQFLTSRNSAALELSVSPSQWYRGMQTLQEWGQIRMEANNLKTVVTICNWRTYQSKGVRKRTASEQPADNQRTTSEQRVNSPPYIDEEGKEGKEEPPYPPEGGGEISKPFGTSPPELATAWVFYCKRRKNRTPADKAEDMTGFFEELSKLVAPERILVEIQRKGRDCSEYDWQFKNRLLNPDRNGHANGPGKPSLADQRAAARERFLKGGTNANP